MPSVALIGQTATISQGKFTQVWVTLAGQTATISQGAVAPGWRFLITLPTLSAFGLMHVNPTMSAVLRLPKLSAVGYGGATFKLTLPTVRVTLGMTIPNIMRSTITLPTLTGSATGQTGMLMEVAATLPRLSGLAYGGATIRITLPKLTTSAHGFVNEHMSAAIVLPKLRGSATGHRFSDTMSCVITLPKLVAGGRTNNLPITLPRLVVKMLATNNAVASMQCWSMNTKNKAVTQFINYPFRAFVRWNNKYYGIGLSGGLYLLEGDLDATVVPPAPIPWSWETGLDDMDSNAMKGVSGIYVEGTIAPGATITLINDQRQRYVYDMHAVTTDQATYRVVTGKGIRTRNVGIAMASVVGGYMEVSQVAPKYVVSKRNI